MTHPVVGHNRARRLLELHLPPVVLLRGRKSIGKWTLAEYIAKHHRVAIVDQFYAPFVGTTGLTIQGVRQLVTWAHLPAAGPFKLALLDMEGTSLAALNALLKILEEPPPKVKFLMVASTPLPATIVSRCATYTLAPLKALELREVLLRQGMAPALASRIAVHGRGQVAPALARAGDAELEPALALVKAIATRDRDMFEWAIDQTNAATRDLLHRWLVEAMSGARTLYTDADMFGLDGQPSLLNTMLRRLSAAPNASARLQVRAALEPLLDR